MFSEERKKERKKEICLKFATQNYLQLLLKKTTYSAGQSVIFLLVALQRVFTTDKMVVSKHRLILNINF